MLSRYNPDHTEGGTFASVAFAAASEQVEIAGGTWTKRGFWLIFRNILVTEEAAFQLRHRLSTRPRAGGLPFPEYQWLGAVVRGVYTTDMELVGCYNTVRCNACSAVEPVSGADKGALSGLEENLTVQNSEVVLTHYLPPISGD